MRGERELVSCLHPISFADFTALHIFLFFPRAAMADVRKIKLPKLRGKSSKENAGMRKNGFDFFFWTVDRANSKWKFSLTCCNFFQKYFQERIEEFEMALLPTQGRTTELISICLSFCLGDWKEEREWKIPFPFVFSASEMQKCLFTTPLTL